MVINWLVFLWYELTLKGISEQTLLRRDFIVDCSTVTGTNVKQSLAQFSTVESTIGQQSLARFLNSCWHYCSTVTGTILQQLLATFFNSHWQYFFLFSMLPGSFNVGVYYWRIVSCTRNTTHDLRSGIRHMFIYTIYIYIYIYIYVYYIYYYIYVYVYIIYIIIYIYIYQMKQLNTIYSQKITEIKVQHWDHFKMTWRRHYNNIILLFW